MREILLILTMSQKFCSLQSKSLFHFIVKPKKYTKSKKDKKLENSRNFFYRKHGAVRSSRVFCSLLVYFKRFIRILRRNLFTRLQINEKSSDERAGASTLSARLTARDCRRRALRYHGQMLDRAIYMYTTFHLSTTYEGIRPGVARHRQCKEAPQREYITTDQQTNPLCIAYEACATEFAPKYQPEFMTLVNIEFLHLLLQIFSSSQETFMGVKTFKKRNSYNLRKLFARINIFLSFNCLQNFIPFDQRSRLLNKSQTIQWNRLMIRTFFELSNFQIILLEYRENLWKLPFYKIYGK